MELFENTDIQELIQAFVALRTDDEAKLFLRDLLTGQEMGEMARRWRVARMLDNGASYSTIEQETGLSSTTIARISKWLQNGSGGYQLMLKKFKDQEDAAENSGIQSNIEVSVNPNHPDHQAPA